MGHAWMIVRANHLWGEASRYSARTTFRLSLNQWSQAQHRQHGHHANHGPRRHHLLLCENALSSRFNKSLRLFPKIQSIG
jgi:hypothetical protein